jgi:hypothetical protein
MQIHRREDIDPNDGIRRYGDVAFADPINNLYPIDTPEHVRSAWARIHIVRNAAFYTPDELDAIKSRIIEAAERFGVSLSEEVIERDARLFAAGDYPDRGVTFTEADLDKIIQNHKPVPICLEHVEMPIELGWVGRIWRKGSELFGRLAFKPKAWELIASSGARRLSAAVKRDKSGLVEVSIVRQPRVENAVIFRADARSDLHFDFNLEKGECFMPETEISQFSNRITELEAKLRAQTVDAQIASLKRDGRIVPASEPYARAILCTGDSQVVTFADGEEKPVAEAFLAFLEAQPKVIEFSELADGAECTPDLSAAEHEICAKLGISAKSLVKHASR